MAITGKTGADAIFKALKHICKVLNSYGAKLDAVISAAVTAEVLTADQAAVARNFISVAQVACSVFDTLSNYSGTN